MFLGDLGILVFSVSNPTTVQASDPVAADWD
jgi:hypothetical protein